MSHATATMAGHVAVGSARLHYELRGSGPALLFIPGGTVDGSHFAEVAEQLADEFRTVTYDRRGNGASPRPAGWHATSIAEQADDAAGLIETLGLAPCAVWGGSLGGVVLLELLARRPGLVRSAIVHEPPLFTVLDDGAETAAELARSAAAAVREDRVGDAFTAHVRTALGGAFQLLTPASRDRMAANADVFFGLEIPALVHTAPDAAKVSGTLATSGVPITFMADPAAEGSPPHRAARRLAELHGAELFPLAGGHMPYATAPARTAEAIRAAVR